MDVSHLFEITPESIDQLYETYGTFAAWFPSDANAVVALSQLIDDLTLGVGYSSFLQQRRILLRSDRKRPLDLILASTRSYLPCQDEHAPLSSRATPPTLPHVSQSNASTSHAPHGGEYWHAFLSFSLNHTPGSARWSMGLWPSNERSSSFPDFPFATELYGRAASIHQIQATVSFSGDFPVLAISSRHRERTDDCLPLTLDGSPIGNTSTNLIQTVHTINVGALEYKVAYTVPKQWRAPFSVQGRRDIPSVQPNAPVNFMSTTSTIQNGPDVKWVSHNITRQGSVSTVQAGVNTLSGDVVAVRHFVTQRKIERERIEVIIKIESNLSRRLSSSPRLGRHFVQQFVESIHHENDIYLFARPLCKYDLAIVLQRDDFTETERDIVFAQIILGVLAIHRCGMVHGDIRPSSVCLKTREPIHVIIVDIAGAIDIQSEKSWQRCVACVPGERGTVGYLAPEKEVPGGMYGQPVDVWAAACVGLDLLRPLGSDYIAGTLFTITNKANGRWNIFRETSTYSDRKAAIHKFNKFRAQLMSCEMNSKEHLLSQMLDPQPTSRISALNAVDHLFTATFLDSPPARECWAKIAQASEKRSWRMFGDWRSNAAGWHVF